MPRKTTPAPEADEPSLPEIEPQVALVFVGDGSRFVPGYPQADFLADADVAARLIATGLWVAGPMPSDPPTEPPAADPVAAPLLDSESDAGSEPNPTEDPA